MTLVRRLRWCVGVLASLGVSTYVSSEHDAMLALVAVPMLALGIWLTRPAATGSRGPVMPAWLIPIAIVGVSAVAMLQARAVGFDVTLIGTFAIALLVIKLGDRRTLRDEGQLIALSAFLVVAALLTSPELLVGVQAAAFFPLLVYGVMVYQLYRGQMEASPELPVGMDASVPRGPLIATSVASTIGCLAVALVVFFITPRGLGDGFMGTLAGPRATATGFSDSVSLGRRGVISESPEVVMDVKVIRRGETIGGPDERFHLRGAVLDVYDPATGAWSAATRFGKPSQELVEMPNGGRALIRESGRAESVVQIRLRHPSRDMFVFTMWKPLRIDFSGALELEERQDTRTYRATMNAGGRAEYTVSVADSWSEKGIDDSRQDVLIDFPSDRVREEATRLLRAASEEPDPGRRPWSGDLRAARVLSESFLTGFHYTLEQPPVTPGVDPIEEFLFTTKRGHCEYFASTLAAMCRSVGIQSRVVTGYVANEYDVDRGEYTVREDDAHAWVEVQAGGHDRWFVLDPTPPEDFARTQERQRTLLTAVRDWFEGLEYLWNRSVVSFDNASRDQVRGHRGEDRAGWLRYLPDPRSRGAPRRVVPSILLGVLATAVAAGVLALVLRGARHVRARAAKRRKFWAGKRAGGLERETAGLYAALLDVWERARVPKPEWRPLMQHAGVVAGTPGVDERLAQASFGAVDLLYAIRFGGAAADAERVREARALLTRAAEPARTDA